MGPFTKSHPHRYTDVLVVIDSFSKWVEIHPLREATAKNIAKILETEIFCRFGMPLTIVSDNGSQFRSGLIKCLCKQWNIRHSFASVYHPQTNLTERANRIIKPMIRSYIEGIKHNQWVNYLSMFKLAINTA